MHHCWWGPHCPYHHFPGWAEPIPPPALWYPPPSRDDYVRRLESERDMLERRLRRLEEQLVEIQRGGRSG